MVFRLCHRHGVVVIAQIGHQTGEMRATACYNRLLSDANLVSHGAHVGSSLQAWVRPWGHLFRGGEVSVSWQLSTVLDETFMGGLVTFLCCYILQLTDHAIPLDSKPVAVAMLSHCAERLWLIRLVVTVPYAEQR